MNYLQILNDDCNTSIISLRRAEKNCTGFTQRTILT